MIHIRRLRHVGIVVKDLDVMLDFYTRVLGFEVRRSVYNDSDEFRKGLRMPEAFARVVHLGWDAADAELELFEFSGGRRDNNGAGIVDMPGYRHLAFTVSDIDQACRVLREYEIDLFSDPVTVSRPVNAAGIRFVYFRDPEGNIIELNQLP